MQGAWGTRIPIPPIGGRAREEVYGFANPCCGRADAITGRSESDTRVRILTSFRVSVGYADPSGGIYDGIHAKPTAT
jgi:hypothetical protein